VAKLFNEYQSDGLGISSANCNDSLVKHVVVPLTAAEILAIATTPKTMVQAEANHVHVFLYGMVVYNYGSVAFTTAHNGGFYYTDNGSGTACTVVASPFLGAADKITTIVPAGLGHATQLVNTPLVFSTSADPDGTATADGTAEIHCWYRTIRTGL
jgi:hypothetical protein